MTNYTRQGIQSVVLQLPPALKENYRLMNYGLCEGKVALLPINICHQRRYVGHQQGCGRAAARKDGTGCVAAERDAKKVQKRALR